VKTPALILFATILLARPLLPGAEIDVPALTVRIEDAITHQPIAGISVYRFYETERVRHFLGIRGIPSPEGVSDTPVAEHYLTDSKGEVKFPQYRLAARLYEVGLGEILYINLVTPGAVADSRDARAFAKSRWRVTPNLHFSQSISHDNFNYSSMILLLNVSLPDVAPRYDGAYAWFSLKRTSASVVVQLAGTKDGKVDGRLSTVKFSRDPK